MGDAVPPMWWCADRLGSDELDHAQPLTKPDRKRFDSHSSFCERERHGFELLVGCLNDTPVALDEQLGGGRDDPV